ncbi:MAG: hypothetical protein EP329_13240 [Deltaproteobacteria bacterium]|nr:MAG: hypothetical protein EP329_13240 [Deltaproteobacteria bacterium]
MSSKRHHLLGLMALVLSFALFACADFERGPGPVPPDTATVDTGSSDATDDSGGGCTPGDYATEIYPLLQLSCDSCHSSSGSAGSTGLVFSGSADDDYAAISGLIDTGNAASSVLVKKAVGSGHGGGAVFSAGGEEEAALICWISSGAPQ